MYHHWPSVQPTGEELFLTEGRLTELAQGGVRALECWDEVIERLQLAHVLPGHAERLERVLFPLQYPQSGLRVENDMPLDLGCRCDAVVGGGELIPGVCRGAVLRLHCDAQVWGRQADQRLETAEEGAPARVGEVVRPFGPTLSVLPAQGRCPHSVLEDIGMRPGWRLTSADSWTTHILESI